MVKVVASGQDLCYNDVAIKKGGQKTVFFGTYFHQMDTKNRIRIPAKFGKELSSKYIVGKSSIDGALAIYTLEDFQKLSKKKHSPFNAKAEMAYTLFFGSYFEVAEDAQGRLQITDAIRKIVQLDKELVSIGADDHINLMSRSRFEQMQQELSFEDALKILDEQSSKSDS